MIEIEGRLTPADMTAASWARLSRRPALWVLLLVTVGIAAAALADGAPWYDGVGLVGVVLGTLWWSLVVPPRQLLRSGPAMGATNRWTFGDTEVRFETVAEDGERLVEGTMPWSALHRVGETRRAFLVFSAPRRCTPIPKRWFASEADVERFRTVVEQHSLGGQGGSSA